MSTRVTLCGKKSVNYKNSVMQRNTEEEVTEALGGGDGGSAWGG